LNFWNYKKKHKNLQKQQKKKMSDRSINMDRKVEELKRKLQDNKSDILDERVAFIRLESQRRKQKIADLKRKNQDSAAGTAVSSPASIPSPDEFSDFRRQTQNGDSTRDRSKSQAETEQELATTHSSVLVSWLTYCREHGKSAYSPDLMGLVEFLSDGHRESEWNHERMTMIAEVVKGAIQRNAGFKGFIDEDLLFDTLKVMKCIDYAKDMDALKSIAGLAN
jgi:hypothetical protein